MPQTSLKSSFSHPDAWNVHLRKLQQERTRMAADPPVLYQPRKKYVIYEKRPWNSQLPD